MTPKVIFIAFAALMATLAAGCDREGPDAAREGNDAFASERYGDAREAYDRALKTIPDRPELDYNSGNTLYREQRFAEAGRRYEDALPDADQRLAADTLINWGNAEYAAGNLEGAIELYKQALRIDPSELDPELREHAKVNLEIAQDELEEQQPEDAGEEDQQESEEGDQGDEQEPQPGPGEPQPDDQQGQQDQPQGQQDENEGQEGDESDGGENEQPSDRQPSAEAPRQQEAPPTGLTEEEARRLLDSLAENTDTLQSRMRRRDDGLGPSRGPPEKPW